MYTLIVRASFDAAHHLDGYDGKCARVHGHTYRVEAEFSGPQLNEHGMLHDFAVLRAELEAALPDHTDLNDVMDLPPTAENIARSLFGKLRDRALPVTAVTVWETENCGCRYVPDEDQGRGKGG